jgi:protein-S-isoprenylcysteine O-methyltransferase Ste14
LVEVPRLGARGGGWVAIQTVILAAVLVVGLLAPGWPDGARWQLKVVAILLLGSGAVILVAAGRALGSGFTPFPRPATGGELVETGPFAVVRHPVYSGGILVAAGISLALSPWALVATGILAAFWALKASLEERLLLESYPAYAEYRERTRYRLVPLLY